MTTSTPKSPSEIARGLINQDCEHMKYGCFLCAEERISKAITAERDEADKLRQEVEDWRDTQKSAMSERCGDEAHCTCVPMLRKEIKELRQQILEKTT